MIDLYFKIKVIQKIGGLVLLVLFILFWIVVWFINKFL